MGSLRDRRRDKALQEGVTRSQIGDYDGAIASWKKAFDLGEVTGGWNIAITYTNQLKDPASAMRWFERVIDTGHPKYLGRAHFHIGMEMQNAPRQSPPSTS